MGEGGILLVGMDDIVDQFGAVAAAARRDQHIVALGPVAGLFVVRHAALQEADELHLGPHRGWHLQPGQRIVEIRRAIDPDRVVEQADLAHDIAALPFGVEQMRRVHDLAQAEHQRRAARLQIGQRLLDLAAQPHRLLVDDENVGLEGLRRVADDRLPHLQRILQVDVLFQRGVFAVTQLDDAGDLHEVDARSIVEGAGDGRARDDQDIEAAEILDERMRDRAASPKWPRPNVSWLYIRIRASSKRRIMASLPQLGHSARSLSGSARAPSIRRRL